MLAGEPMDYQQIARCVGAHPEALCRVLRALAVELELLSEISPGIFTLTDLGKCLLSGAPGASKNMALWWGDVLYRVWGDLLKTVMTGNTAFDQVYGMQLFQYLGENQEAARNFNAAMSGLAEFICSGVVTAYDFSMFQRLVDIGGGSGTLIASILTANPNLKGVLFDQPQVVSHATTVLEAYGVADQCEILEGNFFEAVPSGGDAYILSNVIHNWDDDQAVSILHNCYQAMDERGRLLLVEMVLSGKEEPALARLVDMTMLVLIGGRERTEQEFSKLLARSGFKLERVIPVQSMTCVLEALPV